MTARAARWLWLDQVRDQVRAKTLNPNAGHLALVLAVHYINGHNEAWPSQTELTAATGISRSAIQRAVHDLEQHNLIEVTRGHAAHTSGNVYHLKLNGSQ